MKGFELQVAKSGSLWLVTILAALFIGVGMSCDLLAPTGPYREPDEVVELFSPSDSSGLFLPAPHANFSWHVRYPKKGVTYHSKVFIDDDGGDPFDGQYVCSFDAGEETIDAGEETRLSVTLSDTCYDNWHVWGVLVESSKGKIFKSKIRRYRGEIEVVELFSPGDNSQVNFRIGCCNRDAMSERVFHWDIKHQKEGIVYHSTMLIDEKGSDPFDGQYICSLDAGEERWQYLYLHNFGDSSYAGWFDWAVLVKSSDGKIFKSEVRSFTCGEVILLDSPADKSEIGYDVTFRWHIQFRKEGVSYHSTVLTDKGVNPFDGWYERSYDAGEQTELTVDLRKGWYRGWWFQWGVRVESSEGEKFESHIWNARCIK